MDQKELFDGGEPAKDRIRLPDDQLARLLQRLEEISPDAYDDAVHALFSEQPVAVRRFAEKVIGAAEKAGTEKGRLAAEKARTDRLDPDTEKVQAAAYKTVREFDRLRGLLRFKPEPGGRYTARCAPDHFVLPLLADHFSVRFGDTPWAVIDERRRLVLRGGDGTTEIVPKEACIGPAAGQAGNEPSRPPALESAPADTGLDAWETLWRTYHHTVNNEERNNPKLQRQFIPGRYRKYLTEFL
jgi:probable DNA metabolism protein